MNEVPSENEQDYSLGDKVTTRSEPNPVGTITNILCCGKYIVDFHGTLKMCHSCNIQPAGYFQTIHRDSTMRAIPKIISEETATAA